MRLVTWNCNMALHRKLEALASLEPDVAVLCECAEPSIVAARSGLDRLDAESVWIGRNKHKGLAVLGYNGYRVTLDEMYRASHRYIAPVRVHGPRCFNLLAVWAQNFSAGITRKRQPGPMRLALRRYRDFLTEFPVVVAGDLNNNCIWDKPGWLMNFSHTIETLGTLGLGSVYHHVTNEVFGEETQPTIYWRDRTREGPTYHLDYVFIPHEWLGKVTEMQVGRFDTWCGAGLSDHVPVTVEIDQT